MSADLRQYLALLLVAAATAAVTLGALALDGLLRPGRRAGDASSPVPPAPSRAHPRRSDAPDGVGAADPTRGTDNEGSVGVRHTQRAVAPGGGGRVPFRWSVARAAVCLAVLCLLVPLAAVGDGDALRAAVAALGGTVVVGASTLLLGRRVERLR